MTARARRLDYGRPIVFGLAWLILGFLVLPMVIVFPVSVTDQYYLSMPQETISLEHYAAFFTDEIWLAALADSVIVAVSATVLATILGTLCAIGCWRLSTTLTEGVRTFMLLPIIVPTIVQALAFYRFWAQIGLLDTYIGLILAHTLIALPFVIITVSASLANFDVRQEQAARSLGASMGQAIRWVMVPNLMPGILSGAIFAFTISFDEIVVALFVTSRSVYTLPKRIWDGLQDHLDPTIAAVATLLIALTLALLLTELALRHWRDRRTQ